MARYGGMKKPALSWQSDRDATRVLDKLSKAALIDCVIDLMRPLGESVDDEVTPEQLKERFEVVLERRHDAWPIGGR